jgi:lipid-binding SYLF domain-containing protein
MKGNIDRRHVLAGLVTVSALTALPAMASDLDEAQKIVDGAKYTADTFGRGPELQWVRENIGRAKAILIIPEQVKGGFIIGGAGGGGALLARDAKSGIWSYPAFYTMGTASFGLQIGGAVSEIILLIMTDNGLDSLLASDVKLGTDISAAAGPVGVGAKAATVDVLAFQRSKGLYGGLTVEGQIVVVERGLNEAYYQKGVSTADILIRRNVSNSGAELLRKAVAGLGH